MIASGVLRSAMLATALAAGLAAGNDEMPWTPVAPEIDAPAMVACESGGAYASECQLTCRVLLNIASTRCSVSCISGYYACCTCDDGCKCIMDHEEMWPTYPEPPKPRPVS
jgi:hypothetical protein